MLRLRIIKRLAPLIEILLLLAFSGLGHYSLSFQIMLAILIVMNVSLVRTVWTKPTIWGVVVFLVTFSSQPFLFALIQSVIIFSIRLAFSYWKHLMQNREELKRWYPVIIVGTFLTLVILFLNE